MTSLDLTYDLIPASYALVVERLGAIENRIQSIMVFSASFLLTGPALAAVTSNGLSFNSNLFYVAISLAVINIVVGLPSRTLGTLHMPRPHNLDSGWLELDPQEFKRSAIWWANWNLDHNLKLVNAKGFTSLLMTVVLIAELALLIAWGLTQVR